MAGVRCWDNFPSKLNRDSSYLTQKTKSKSIYGYMKGVAKTNGPLPKASCNCKYYGGLYINSTTKCLVHADSYELFLDVTKGQYYCNPDISNNLLIDREIYQGTILQSDYNNVNVVLPKEGLDSSFNYVIWPPPTFTFSGETNLEFPGAYTDPCGQIFYSNCDVVPWFTRDFGSVDISNTYISNINYAIDPSGQIIEVQSQYASQNGREQDLVCFKFPKCLQFS